MFRKDLFNLDLWISLLINPDYKIYYVDGHTKNDILVAFI